MVRSLCAIPLSDSEGCCPVTQAQTEIATSVPVKADAETRLERLTQRFQSLAAKTGRNKQSSYSVSVGKCMDDGWSAELGGYDVGDWPRHVYVGAFERFGELLEGLEAKEAEAEN